MKRYKDYEGMKQKLKTYSKKTGLKYRNMGCQESNNYSKLTRRMKKKRMSWSKKGSENAAKVITMYASESCTDIIKHLNIQILPESFIEYAEKYIKEIEENIREMKKQKTKMKKEYTLKQGSINGYPQIKKILENKTLSELILYKIKKRKIAKRYTKIYRQKFCHELLNRYLQNKNHDDIIRK